MYTFNAENFSGIKTFYVNWRHSNHKDDYKNAENISDQFPNAISKVVLMGMNCKK